MGKPQQSKRDEEVLKAPLRAVPRSSEFLQRFERFTTDWRRARGTLGEVQSAWETFFDNWRAHAPERTGPKEKVVFEINEYQFSRLAIEFRTVFEAYRGSGMRFNVWKAAQLGRDEKRNCRVLATFLDHFEDHGHGSEILCRLLSELGLVDFARSAARQRYYTRTEVWPLANPESWVDIEIEDDDFVVFIEAKVRAPELGDQLERYVDLVRQKAARRSCMVIYLTPDGRAPSNPRLGDIHEIRTASWSQVSRAVRSSVGASVDRPIDNLLRQYAEFLETFR